MSKIINTVKKYKKTSLLILVILLVIAFIITVSVLFSSKNESYIRYDDFKTPTRIIKYTYHNDKVIKQESSISTPYNLLKKTQEQAKFSYSGVSGQLKNIKGISSTIDFEKSVVLEKVMVNFNAVSKNDLKKYQQIMAENGVPISSSNSLKESEKLLKSDGFLSFEEYNNKKEEQQP